MRILVETKVDAPIEQVWKCWTTPADIMKWNTASQDWHTTSSAVDLRPGGHFTSRMEAKDGSMGFDFAGVYSRVEEPHLIEATFGDRTMRVAFIQETDGVRVQEEFDAETAHPVEMQRAGWQAILDRFKSHVESAR